MFSMIFLCFRRETYEYGTGRRRGLIFEGAGIDLRSRGSPLFADDLLNLFFWVGGC